MAATEKRVFSPAFTGVSCTALLLVSHLLSKYSALSPDIGALNTVLRIIAMCECVHLVRVTSALSYSHVWDSVEGVLLFLMPSVNLIVTAVQLFAGDSVVPSGAIFTAVLTLFSLPSFFCYYFAFYLRMFGGKNSRIMQNVSRLVGIAYTVIRIADKSLFPALASKYDLSSVSFLVNAVSCSSMLSFGLYVLSAVSFVFSMITYGRKRRR